MVRLDVQFEVRQQVVFPQEVQARRRVGIVLVLGRFLRFWLDVELALEPDLLLVIHRQMQKRSQMLLLALHVGVEQRHVALAPAPERVALAAQLMSDFHGLLHLRRGIGKHIRIAAGARAMRITRMRKRVGRAPQQLDAGALLLFLEDFGDGVEIPVRLG